MTARLSIDPSVFYGEHKLLIETEGSTLGECLDALGRQQPALSKTILSEDGAVRAGVMFKLNDSFLIYDPLSNAVNDGDKIEITADSG